MTRTKDQGPEGSIDNARVPRLAWFSPMPPTRCGPATDSAALVPALQAWYDIEVFVDAAPAPAGHAAAPVAATNSVKPRPRSAHDFVWRHRQTPYDLTVYQLGNSAVHDFMWPYLFRYPGLTVFHDVHLHHARAAALLQRHRVHDYRVEFAANHPGASPDAAELAVAGFDSHLYYHWPMTRLAAEASRLSAVHAEQLAARLRFDAPRAAVETIRLGHGPSARDSSARDAIRARYGIHSGAVLFGVFGGLSPEKRLPQVLAAFASTRAFERSVRLLLAGQVPAHYDLQADVRRRELGESVVVTGYLASDAELDAHIAACDAALTMRWPTAREISGPWLRCLAAGVPTVMTQLEHLVGVPWVDPRTWTPEGAEGPPATVAIDILDEDHSLRLAMRRLARDEALRRAIGTAGRRWWEARHSPAAMVEDYRRIIPLAMARPAPAITLPPHLRDDGRGTLERVLAPLGVSNPLG